MKQTRQNIKPCGKGKKGTHPHVHKEEAHFHDVALFERKRLLIAIILTALMMAAEIAGGLITGSLALLSDAGHMLTHSFALLVSFFAALYIRKPATKEKSFGFYRVEILAALFNGITLVVISGFIFWEAYKRIMNPRPVQEKEMFIIAVIGLAVNIATALILWKASKRSLNIRSAFIHMLGDAVSSIGVVAGAVIIYFTGFYIIDPVFSILIAALILVWSITLIKDSVRILMESTPKNIDVELVAESIAKIDACIKGTHDLHIWEITSGMYCLSAHLSIDDMKVSSTSAILEKIQICLKENFNIIHPIIQFEAGKADEHKDHCAIEKKHRH